MAEPIRQVALVGVGGGLFAGTRTAVPNTTMFLLVYVVMVVVGLAAGAAAREPSLASR